MLGGSPVRDDSPNLYDLILTEVRKIARGEHHTGVNTPQHVTTNYNSNTNVMLMYYLLNSYNSLTGLGKIVLK